MMTSVVPVTIVAALVFALSPVCTMPECGLGALDSASAPHSCGADAGGPCEGDPGAHPCGSYLAAADRPDGIIAPQALGVEAPGADDTFETLVFSAYGHVPVADVPLAHDDPLGSRLRI